MQPREKLLNDCLQVKPGCCAVSIARPPYMGKSYFVVKLDSGLWRGVVTQMSFYYTYCFNSLGIKKGALDRGTLLLIFKCLGQELFTRHLCAFPFLVIS